MDISMRKPNAEPGHLARTKVRLAVTLSSWTCRDRALTELGCP